MNKNAIYANSKIGFGDYRMNVNKYLVKVKFQLPLIESKIIRQRLAMIKNKLGPGEYAQFETDKKFK